MSVIENIFQHREPKQVSSISLKVFFNIASGWSVSPKQQMILLGSPPRSTFYKWRKGAGPAITQDTLERISYIMGIYKALRLIYPTAEQANSWPQKPNKDFNNDSALSFMLKGGVSNLSDVRRYLDKVIGQ